MPWHSVSPRIAFAAAVVAISAACGSADRITSPRDSETPAAAVASVSVVGDVSSLQKGQTVTLSATPKDAAGRPLAGRAVQWASSNEGVATVTAAGRVAAVGAGTARISASSEGKRGEMLLEVTPLPVAEVTLDVSSFVLEVGETRQLTVTARDAEGARIDGLPVQWSASGGYFEVMVSATGLVTAQRAGTGVVSARVGGKLAQAAVTVLDDAQFDLVFDRWDSGAANVQRPWLHRLDMRTPGAVPAGIFAVAGTSDAAPSPDGAKIAFVCDGDGPAICVANRDGSGVVVLPGFSQIGGMLGDQPAWSPDGSRIAFRGWTPGGPPGVHNPADIWVMNADGSGKARLTTGAREVESHEAPAWSPRQADGSYRVAFAHVTRGPDGFLRSSIQSVRADGEGRAQVTVPGAYVDNEPSWSPDGGTIAFVRSGGPVAGDVWLASASGGQERALMPAAEEPAGAQRSPAWSPDGALIAFASNHDIILNYYAWQIYTVRTDGTRVTRRTSDRADKGNPSWIRR